MAGNERLWTKNFTIITLGTVVSMLGNSISGFAISLMVLDATGSVFLMALVNVAYNLPRVLMPILAGPYLDRFSRVKTIFGLDFFSAGLYALLGFLMYKGWIHYAVILAVAPLLGTVDSVYGVAYDSLFPTLVAQQNLRKAYSVSTIIQPLSAVMVPVAAFLYDKVGLAPLFAFNAVTFLAAAVFETQIRTNESQIRESKQRVSPREYFADLKAGFSYMRRERGLLIIAAYFSINTLLLSCNVLALPYFKATPTLGVQWYTYVMGCGILGRVIGGALQYKIKLPAAKKFVIAVFIYFFASTLDGVYLFTPLPLMMAMSFLTGITYVTSYNIRLSTTQDYVPNDFRGRFNGAFAMLTTLGGILGQLILGALGDVYDARMLIAICLGLNLVSICALMLPNAKYVKKVYNRDL
ncbi:MAG: MFS transporter [Eubacteriales bacterium]|nr:MFS transporter [Eubacteriales bacterium]